VIEIGPGLYSEQVVLKPYVSLVGAGIDSTRIAFNGGSDAASGATVIADDSDGVPELFDVSDLSIVSTGGDFSIGLYAAGERGSTVLRDVAIQVNDAANTDLGVYAIGAQVTLRHSAIDADIGSTPNGTTYAVLATFNSVVRCDVCQIKATGGSGFALYQLGGFINVGSSRIEGSVQNDPAAIRCPSSYDETYVAKSGC
jgi:hypothetical protein